MLVLQRRWCLKEEEKIHLEERYYNRIYNSYGAHEWGNQAIQLNTLVKQARIHVCSLGAAFCNASNIA